MAAAYGSRTYETWCERGIKKKKLGICVQKYTKQCCDVSKMNKNNYVISAIG